MMVPRRIRPVFVGLSLFALSLASGFAQSGVETGSEPAAQAKESMPASATPVESPAVVLRVRVLLTKDYPALEIVTDRPVVPSIHKLEGPARLTIDLPNTGMSLQHKEIPINTEQLGSLHLDEEKGTNQAVHMIVDLRKPLAYTWEAAGNRLTIRLQSAEPAAAAAPTPATDPAPPQPTAPPLSVPSMMPGIQPGLVPVTPGGFGAIIFAGNRVAPGSTITAGTDTAVLSMGKGGEVHLCPRTTVSVTASSSGHDLMLGMSTGSLEAHYNLDASINSVLTPDFRILLAGPGVFEYAISADIHGNTCVGALPGNTRPAMVYELMGTGSYEVKPSEQVMFHSGRVSAADNNMAGSCGCPTPVPVMRASEPAGPVVPDSKLPASVQLAQGGNQTTPQQSVTGTGTQPQTPGADPAGSETSAPPATKPNDVQASVEAPLIFRASDLPPAKPSPPAKPKTSPATSDRSAKSPAVALPPSTITITTQKPHHGFFGKVKGFFKAIFS
jgi:hypothetical protein